MKQRLHREVTGSNLPIRIDEIAHLTCRRARSGVRARQSCSTLTLAMSIVMAAASLPPAPLAQTSAAHLPAATTSALLYQPGADALSRFARAPSAAQSALEKRCRDLMARGTPVSQLPQDCVSFVPRPSLFAYVMPLTVRIPPASPTPPQAAPLSEARCRVLIAKQVPSSQLPPECVPFAPSPPTPPNARLPQCVDPSVLTHVSLVPCPPPASPPQQRTPPPSAGNPSSPPSTRVPPPPSSSNPPRLPVPTPPTQPPVVATAPTQPPTPTPPSPPSPPAPPAPIAVVPVPVPSLPPPAPPAIPVARGAASLTPMGGGSSVAPLALPSPRQGSVSAPAQATVSPDPQEIEPGEVVVFAPFAQNATGALEVIRSAGGTVLMQERLGELEGLLLRVRADDGDALRLAQTLRVQLPQASVDLHSRLFLFPLAGSAGQGGAPRHFARAMLQLPTVAPPFKREVRVGIIDSGVERVGALVEGVADQKSFLPNDASPADSVHGTAVAALIAGRDDGTGFAGAAPGARLYIARAMSVLPDGRSYTNAVSVLQALNWLLSQKVPIVNMSLGGKGDSTLALGIAQAIRKGIIVVAAAGNGGQAAAASFPAALPDVIAVTAVDVEAKLYPQANRGEYVMVAAPGVDIWAPQRGGGVNGGYVSGTSFAAAWVSGALAVAAGQTAAIDRAKWMSALCASARDLGRSGRDNDFGCGLLQVTDFAARLQ